MNAPAPTDAAALREALEITLEKALSPYQALSRWVRGEYASNLAVDAALGLMLPILAERDAALARATTTDAALARALDRIAGLEKEIHNYLDGNYDQPRAHRPGKCRHGIWFYETCESCIDDHFKAALTSQEDAS